MATITESRLTAKTVVPSFTVDDLPKSIAFYEGLGFLVSFDEQTFTAEVGEAGYRVTFYDSRGYGHALIVPQ